MELSIGAEDLARLQVIAPSRMEGSTVNGFVALSGRW